MFEKKSNARGFSVMVNIILILAATPLQAGRAGAPCYLKWDGMGTNSGGS